ncbi:MAG: 8-oxo-dGTP diphosphatase [Pseudomonadota bacterium]
MSETNPGTPLPPLSGGDQSALARAASGWAPDLIGTLIFVVSGRQVLLIEKRTGHGAGLLNGPGGKLEGDESPQACARRELQEELGVSCERLASTARLRFMDAAGAQWLGFAFRGDALSGIPTQSVEARPLWYPIGALPLNNMWPDDAIWLPRLLAGESFSADLLLNGQRLLAWSVRPGTPALTLDGEP